MARALVRWVLAGWQPPRWIARVPALQAWLPDVPAVPGAPVAALASPAAGSDPTAAGPRPVLPAPLDTELLAPAGRPVAAPTRTPLEPVPCVDAFPWPFSADPVRRQPAAAPALHPARRPQLPAGGGRAARAVAALEAGPPVPPMWTVSVVVVAAQPAAATEAVLSVAAQSYPAWELIVVVTGDGPPGLSPVQDPRVRTLAAPGAGMGVARDRGVEAATGALVAHLAAGERMGPHWLAAAATALAAEPSTDVVTGQRVASLRRGVGSDDHLVPVISPDDDLSRVAHRREVYGVGGRLTPHSSRHLDVPAVVHQLIDLRAEVRPAAGVPPERLPLPVGSL